MSYNACLLLSDYTCNSCPTTEKGRIRHVAFTERALSKQSTFDPESSADWYDLICNNYAKIIYDVRGAYDGSTAVEGAGYGSLMTRMLSRNHQVTYNHLFTCENVDFYNELAKKNSLEFWWTNGSKLFRSTNPSFAFAQAAITDDMNSDIEYLVTVKWSHEDLPTCYDLPANIFESCEVEALLADCYTCNPVSIITC